MNNQKLFLVGMVRGNRQLLEQSIVDVLSYVDGVIFTVDSRAKQEDIDWLNSIKGDGEIIVKKWVNDHSHTMNETLFIDKMKFSDYFVVIDESDKLNPLFARDLRESIKYWHKNNIGCVWIDHPFIVRYHAGIRFVNSPHWTISNVLGEQINLTQIPGYKKESYVFNLRDTLKSGFLSPIKYTFEYPPFSNHFQLLYGQFSQGIWAKHESMRIRFQLSCQQELGLELTVDAIKDYMINNVGEYPDWFEEYIEAEVNIKDAFRLFVLNQPWQDLAINRFNWSYFTCKNHNIVDQGKYDGYIGLFNQYRLAQNKEME